MVENRQPEWVREADSEHQGPKIGHYSPVALTKVTWSAGA